MLRALLVVLLVIFLIGLLPIWPYSANWNFGYFPSIGTLVLLIIVLAVLSNGRGEII